MKVYIAQRMSGLTREEILEEREKGKAIVRVYHPDAEFIESYFEDYDVTNGKTPMDYFAETAQLMAKADLCAFLPGFFGCHGAEVEDHIAIAYNIPRMYISFAVGQNVDSREFINHETEQLING